MAENSKIEWTHHTFNPWIGCTKVSPGCDHCYAEALATRYKMAEWGQGRPRNLTSESNWRQPLKWDRAAAAKRLRARVFCASLADVFDNEVPGEWRARLWELIKATPNLDWLLLTKRIGNAATMLPESWGDGFHNVWLGATIVNQEEANRDIPKLLAAPARVRFLSMEPLLGPVDLLRVKWPEKGEHRVDVLRRGFWHETMGFVNHSDMPGNINWVIVGGESGPCARPMHPQWARSLRDQCRAAGTPFLFKQWGAWVPVGPLYANEDTPQHLAALETEDDLPTECHITLRGYRWRADFDGQPPNGTWAMKRLGKAAAGRMLDDKEWNEFPELSA